MTILVPLGGFRHIFSLKDDQIKQFLNVLYMPITFGYIPPVLGKLSIAITILRVRGSTASILCVSSTR